MRPKFRTTSRVRNAVRVYDDKQRSRFVVSRRAGGVTRKTSVRYRWGTYEAAQRAARILAQRLHRWPAEKLRDFIF